MDILSVRDAADIIPNFYVPDYGSRMTSSIYVRGLGARIDQPAIGLNVDNVPILNKDAFDFDIDDIVATETPPPTARATPGTHPQECSTASPDLWASPFPWVPAVPTAFSPTPTQGANVTTAMTIQPV